MRIAVIDTETTGMEPPADRVVEVAAAFLVNDDPPRGLNEYGLRGEPAAGSLPFRTAGHMQCLCNPERDIPPQAKAVHHITEAMVVGKPTLKDRLGWPDDPTIKHSDIYAAHNMAFDWGFLSEALPADKPRICTWRVAQHLWPDAPAYGNQVLRYWRGVEPPYMPASAGQAHRALYDALCTAGLLLHMIEGLHDSTGGYDQAVAELVRLSDPALPIIHTVVRFSKHAGQRWDAMDLGFCQWVAARDFDADTIATARFHASRLRDESRARIAARAAARTNPPGLTS